MVVVSQTVRNVLTELTAQWSMTDPPRYRSEYSIATPSRVSTAYYVRNSQERYLPKLPGRSCVTGRSICCENLSRCPIYFVRVVVYISLIKRSKNMTTIWAIHEESGIQKQLYLG